MDLAKYSKTIDMANVFSGFQPGLRTVELVAISTERDGKQRTGKDSGNRYFQLELRLPVNPKTGNRSVIWENVTPVYVEGGSDGMDACLTKVLCLGGDVKGNVTTTEQFYNALLKAFQAAIGNKCDAWVYKAPVIVDGKQVVGNDGRPKSKFAIDWDKTPKPDQS